MSALTTEQPAVMERAIRAVIEVIRTAIVGVKCVLQGSPGGDGGMVDLSADSLHGCRTVQTI